MSQPYISEYSLPHPRKTTQSSCPSRARAMRRYFVILSFGYLAAVEDGDQCVPPPSVPPSLPRGSHVQHVKVCFACYPFIKRFLLSASSGMSVKTGLSNRFFPCLKSTSSFSLELLSGPVSASPVRTSFVPQPKYGWLIPDPNCRRPYVN